LAVKIRVSYERPEELEQLKKRLGNDVKRIKEPKQQEGKFHKAYIELNENLEKIKLGGKITL